MAFWLVACKEIDGSLYVCRLSKAYNTTTPGIPSEWYYVGPGKDPKIQLYSGNEFILVFDYLSHLTARVLDITIWPPTIVNPIQLESPITVQQPQEALLVSLKSYTNFGLILEFPMPPQIQATPVSINNVSSPPVFEYSTTITTVSNYNPGPDEHWYRLYRQPLNGGAWTLIMDWTPYTLDYTDTTTGSLQFNYRATLGLSFNRATPNDPTQHFEGIPGNIVSVNSEIPPFYYAPVLSDSFGLDIYGDQITAFSDFGTRQIYYVEEATDVIDFEASPNATESAAFGVIPPILVLTLTTPFLSFPLDTESMAVFSNASYLSVSNRQDQP